MPILRGNLPPITRVAQPVETGCAIACVAMVTGVPFDRVAREVHGPWWKRKRDVSAYLSDLVPAVRRLGFTCRLARDFREKRLRAILLFEWPWSPGDFHCVVWDPFASSSSSGGRVIDPGLTWPEPTRFYLREWRRGGSRSLVVAPRRR